MGCLKLSYGQGEGVEANAPSIFWEVYKKGGSGEKNCVEYYRYGFQGEYSEEDPETGWNSFELRMYDPVIGRFLVPDPMNEFWSPYLAMGNNPVNLIDPTGGTTDNPFGSGGNYIPDQGGGRSNFALVLDGFTFTYEVDAVTAFFDNVARKQQGETDRSIFGYTPPPPQEGKLFGFDIDFYGYEFFNSGGQTGQTIYYVHSGKAYGAIYDPSTAVITFGKLGNKKGFPKGHVPKTSLINKVKVNVQVFKDMSEVHAKGGNITKSIEQLTTNPISKTMAGTPNEQDSVWRHFAVERNGVLRHDSVKVVDPNN